MEKRTLQGVAGSMLFLAAMYGVVLAAMFTHSAIHRETKHKHKDNTAPGTQVFKDRGGDDLTMSLTTFHHSGDAAICGLLQADFGGDSVDRARSLDGVKDITLAYQGAEAQHLLHLRVGSIRHSIPDDPEDAEAVIGEIYSVSGDFNLVLQQGGVVSVKEGGELFATEVVCEVADHEQRRRLASTGQRVVASLNLCADHRWCRDALVIAERNCQPAPSLVRLLLGIACLN